MNKSGSKKNVFALVAAVFIIAAAVFGLSKVSFFFDYNRLVSGVIQTGEIVLNSPEDINKYFVFLTADEAKSLLEKQAAEKAVFLFPQIDLVFDDQPIIIKQEKASVEGREISFMTFSGLNVGARIYLGEKSALKGAASSNYVWFTERSESRPAFAKTVYIAASPALGGLLAKLDSVYGFFPAGEAIASLNVKSEMTSPVEAQVALYISDGERNDYAVFANMLRKNGKFVLITR